MVAAPPPLLLLFDIDGTLLRRASHEHALALYEAMDRVFGTGGPDDGPQVEAAGRTDLEIARATLMARGVSQRHVDERLDEVRVLVAELYAQRVPDDLSATVVPGMAGLLDRLVARDDVRLSLVTGNLEPVARLKLRAAGIGHHFPSGQGGFGSDSEDRTDLPPIARQRAGGDDDAPHPRERTLVIGDTPRDIACARADELRVVAVTTGPYRTEDLGGADAVAASVDALWELIEREIG